MSRVEWLVVLVSTSVLGGLTFLAVAEARAQNRKESCGTNIKRLALALQNYHDTFLYLPYGARIRTLPPAYDKPSWGSSWLVGTLPFTEQRPLFDKLYAADLTKAENDYISPAIQAIANEQKLTHLFCPDSPLPAEQLLSKSKVMVPSYVGIMGAVPTEEARTQGRDPRYVAGPYEGFAAGNGMLTINDSLTMSACTDGTANTILVGEISDWYYDDAGKKLNPSLSIADAGDGVKAEAGWPAGCLTGINPRSRLAPIINRGEAEVPADRVCNLVAVRHAVGINNKAGDKDDHPNWKSAGIGRCGLNNPFLSAHPDGAANVGFLDGHVKVLKPGLDVEVLRKLATRDDGERLPKDF